MTAPVSLFVDGTEYAGWKHVRVTRGLLRATSDFELAVSERWTVEGKPMQIAPGMACEVRTRGKVLLTGWVDAYKPSYDAQSHNVSVSGRSKTCDFVDSSVLVDGGQFRGLTVGTIARQLAKPYDLTVKVLKDGEPEAEVQVQQGETCFALVERLSRLQELLVTDDAEGNLVLTRAGAGRAAVALRHGKNILSASADLDHSKRFSDVIVKAQRPGNSNKSNDDAPEVDPDDPDGPDPERHARLRTQLDTAARIGLIANTSERFLARMRSVRDGTTGKKGSPKTLTQIHGAIKDPEIKRYRPMVIVAEAQADDMTAEKRADWEIRRRKAEGTKATIVVNGWRQDGDGGELWSTNLMTGVVAPWLGLLERELVIAELTYSYDEGGEKTTFSLTLPDAFLPDKVRKAKAKKAAGGGGGDAKWWGAE
jgi:prophage tail gpP-like protein